MRSTILTVLAVAGGVIARDNVDNFNADTAPLSTGGVVTQISDGESPPRYTSGTCCSKRHQKTSNTR
jgi:hypothetical protein